MLRLTFLVLICLLPTLCPALSADNLPRAHVPERPIIFVPGILGSRLCQAGRPLWGDSGRASLANFSQLDFSLHPDPPITACGLVSQVQVLGPLYSVDAYVKLQEDFRSWGLVEGRRFFIFSYDWRQSNADSARDLETFINEKIGRTEKVDILSHSMGGIVSRLYIERVKGHQRVNKVIYMATPFLGSMNTLGTLSEGWGTLPNWLAGGIDAIRATALSFPSMLELMPRYARCCSIKAANGQYADIDVFKLDTWNRYHWLPTTIDQAAFGAALAKAKAMSDVLAQAPAGVKEVRIAGRAKDTRLIFTIKDGVTDPSEDNWHFTMQGGDGTVPVWSAARNPSLSDLSGTLPSFSEHATIFDDPAVIEQLERELFPIPADIDRPIAGLGNPALAVVVDGQARTWSVERTRIMPKATYVSVGSGIEAKLILKLAADARDVRGNVFKPGVFVRENGVKHAMSVADITTAGDAADHQLVFRASGVTAASEGTDEILLELPDSRELREFVVVLR